MGGGPVWDSVVFLKSVTYRPTLSKFRVGPVKKTPCKILSVQLKSMASINYVNMAGCEAQGEIHLRIVVGGPRRDLQELQATVSSHCFHSHGHYSDTW